MTTLLIVDDNRFLMDLTLSYLQGFISCQIMTAFSYQEALEQASQVMPDLAIVDWVLPDGDGLVLLDTLTKKNPNLEAIMISGDQLTLGSKAHLKKYIINSLVKPYELKELLSSILASRAMQEASDCEKTPIPHLEEEPPDSFSRIKDNIPIDRHKAKNHLSALLAGLRSYSVELKDVRHEPEKVEHMVDDYTKRLINVVNKLSDMFS